MWHGGWRKIVTVMGPTHCNWKAYITLYTCCHHLHCLYHPMHHYTCFTLKSSSCLKLLIHTTTDMTTLTTSSLSDTLSAAIPKLEAEGENWAIFFIWFMDTVEAKGFWGHFDGSTLKPTLSSTPTEDEIKAKNQWDKNKRSAKTLLTQKLPDLTIMEIHSEQSVKEWWEAVVKKYMQKGVYMQTELRVKFLMSRCLDKLRIFWGVWGWRRKSWHRWE